jgi:acetyl-CoA carboxylase biotin carboxyl carrier protein
LKKIKGFPESVEEISMSSKIDYEEINRLIKLLEDKNLAEFELEVEGFKIKIRRNSPAANPPSAQPAPAAFKHPAATEEPFKGGISEFQAEERRDELHFITSPMVGTFYRAPAPNAAPFVEVDEPVKKAQTLCIVEAMKLMNEIECDVDGIVKEIYVENGKPVEFGQRLFAILPTA